MPPKAKFTKEDITNAALEIVRGDGIAALTARELAKKLGSSSCPIFTVFESMEEIKEDALLAAKALYKEYIDRGLAETPAFKGVGCEYISFAVREPKLFQLLFMNEQTSPPGIGEVLPKIDESYDKILASITEGYGLGEKDAVRLYRHLWIYSHGIAALCATGMCRFTGEEISRMMTEVFVSLLRRTKEEADNA